MEAIRGTSWDRTDRRGQDGPAAARLASMGKVRSEGELVRQFGARRLAKRLVRGLGYDRMEYLDFLVKEARNEANSVELRFEMWDRLDRMCQAIAVAHPVLAEKLAFLDEDRRRMTAMRRMLTARKNKSGRLRGKGSAGGRIVVGQRRDLVSPFKRFVAREKGDGKEE